MRRFRPTAYGLGVRARRLTAFGSVLIVLLPTSLAVTLFVDALAVPAGVVAAIVVLLLVADGSFAAAIGAQGGTQRLDIRSQDMLGPRRARFADDRPAGVSDEVADEAWRRERRRRQVQRR